MNPSNPDISKICRNCEKEKPNGKVYTFEYGIRECVREHEEKCDGGFHVETKI